MYRKKLKQIGAWALALTLAAGAVQLPAAPVKAADITGEMQSVLDSLSAPEVSASDIAIYMPNTPSGVSVRFCADYEQVVGEDGTIYTPLEDKQIKGFYEVTQGEASAKTSEFTFTVPGLYSGDSGVNEKPAVIPELQEWHGGTGTFLVSAKSRIVVGDDELMDVANKFARDYKDITGLDISVISGGSLAARLGDFYMALVGEDAGLDKEGYTIDIGNTALIEAEQPTGAYWATRTILQILKQTSGSIPKGLVRDYPKYEVRGFSFDIGRKPFSLDTVYQFAENMSWYKMNSFQLHLSDNLIFHEDYPTLEEAIEQSYAGFRLESDVVSEETGNSATSEDMYYTKDEFRTFIQDCRVMGVDVVPEFDMPAHALPFTRAFPEYMTKKAGGGHKYLIEELNLEKEGVTEWAQSIWNDYFEGPNPVFDEEMTVHIGTDEYHGTDGQAGKELFRKFSDDMIKFVQDTGRNVRMWGSLTNKSGTTPVASEGVQLNIWNTGYANPQDMYNLGYDLINTLEGPNYIVPAAGYYNNYINTNNIYTNWQPNVIGNLSASAGDDQILGGCYAIWHDSIDTRANGISEYDSFDRFFKAVPAYGAKLWGDAKDRNYNDFMQLAAKTGTAPNTNMYAKADSAAGMIANYTFDGDMMQDSSANGYHLISSENVSLSGAGISQSIWLKGGSSYVETPLDMIGDGAVLTMEVKMDADARGEQILCESKDTFGTYGTYAIKASQKETGKVGFSREGYHFSFDYTLPSNEWVELSFRSGQDSVALYVDGELVDDNPEIYFATHPTTELTASLSAKRIIKTSTMLIPLGRIGSKTNSFKGEIAYVSVAGTKEVSGDYNHITKAELQGEVDSYDAGVPELYTDVSWNAYKKASEGARAVLGCADSTQEDYVYAYECIQSAKKALQEKPDYFDANLNLAAGIEAAEEQLKNAAVYTTESVSALSKAVTSAKEVLRQKGTDKNALDTALLDLQKVTLVTKASVVRTQLENAVAAAKQKLANTAGFTAESVAALQQALQAAEGVLAKADASAEELTSAMNALNSKELVKDTGALPPVTEEPKLKKDQEATINGVTYKVTDETKQEVSLIKGKDTKNVKIGATVAVNGITCKITEIAANAYKNSRKVKTVVIGSNVTSVGKNAFSGCTAMTTVTLGKSVKTINAKAFYNCKKLKKVILQGKTAPSVKSNAFGKTASKVTVQAKGLSKAARRNLLKKLKNPGKISKKSTVK